MGQAKLKAALNASLRTKGFSGRDTANHEVAHAVMTVLVGRRVKEVDIHILPSPIKGRSKKIPSTGEREGASRKAQNKNSLERYGLPNVMTSFAGGIYETMVSPSNHQKIVRGAQSDFKKAMFWMSYIWGQNFAFDAFAFGNACDAYPPASKENLKAAWLAIHKAVRPTLEHHLPVLRQLADELLTSPKGRLRGGRILEVVTEFHKERPYSTDAVMEKLSLELTQILGTPRYPPVHAVREDGLILGATTGFSDPSRLRTSVPDDPSIRE